MSDMPRLRDLLAETGARIGMDRAAEAGALWTRWEEIVGDAIAEHAEPSSLRRGVLKVRAVSAAWATEIGYLSEHIMKAANEALGGPVVTEVQVWTAPGPVRRKRGSGPPEATGEPSDRAVRAAPSNDPEEALARARAAWSRRRPMGSPQPPANGAGKPDNPW